MPLERHHIPTLDGWRGIAILALIAVHGGSTLFNPSVDSSFYSNGFLYVITRSAVFGVSLFFSLSGFLITSRLLATKRIDLKDFYIRRGFKLIPVIAIYLLFISVLAFIDKIDTTSTDILSVVLLYRNFLVPLEWYSGQFWSLAVEEHFYLIWPASLFFFSSKRYLIPSVVACCLALGLWRYLDAHHNIANSVLGITNSIYLRTDTRFDALLWGAFWALLLQSSQTTTKVRNQITFIRWIPIFLLAFGAPLLFTSSTYKVMQTQAVFFPICFVGTSLHPHWRISKWLDGSILRFFGKISFSLYIWQQFFFLPEKGNMKVFFPPEFYASGWAPLFCAVAGGYLSYRFIEVPALRLRDRFLTQEGNPNELALDDKASLVHAPKSAAKN